MAYWVPSAGSISVYAVKDWGPISFPEGGISKSGNSAEVSDDLGQSLSILEPSFLYKVFIFLTLEERENGFPNDLLYHQEAALDQQQQQRAGSDQRTEEEGSTHQALEMILRVLWSNPYCYRIQGGSLNCLWKAGGLGRFYTWSP